MLTIRVAFMHTGGELGKWLYVMCAKSWPSVKNLTCGGLSHHMMDLASRSKVKIVVHHMLLSPPYLLLLTICHV